METKIASVVVPLLFIGIVMMVGTGMVKEVEARERVCLQICYTDAAYMTCPSTGSQKLKPACNCCIGGPGCSLYRDNGEQIC